MGKPRLRLSDLEALLCRRCGTKLFAFNDKDDIVDLDPDNIGYCQECWGKLVNMTSDEILQDRKNARRT